jgi:hypothetical protein
MKRPLAILAAYALATYIEALTWRLFALYQGVSFGAVFHPKHSLDFVLSPIVFPIRYSPFLSVRTTEEFAAVLGLYFAPLITFLAVFIGAYLLLRNKQRCHSLSLK